MEWSKEQIQAIEKKGANILVSASAGSGKTAVLVERIINKVVNQKIDIDKLLVVTFTNAAASEMKQKLLEAIYKKIDENPSDEHLQKQILLLNRAHISTIHSFCLDVIRNNFFEIGMPANFRVGDSAEIEIMKQEVMEDIFEKKYEENNEEFLKLLELYTKYSDDEPLKIIILKIFESTRSLPYPEKWLDEKIEEFNIKEEDFSKTIWGKDILEKSKELLKDCLSKLETARKIVYNSPALLKCLNMLLVDIDDVSGIKLDTWDDLYNGMTKKFDNWPSKIKADEEELELKDKAKVYRDEAKERFNEVKSMVTANSEDAIRDIKAMYPVLKSIQKLILEFNDEFNKRKREKNIVDFSDLEHLALKLLVDEKGNKTKIAEKYNFEEVAIDEYQDSNFVQEKILNSVSNGKNMFMVGDIKQSIYRFREARPELFLEKYEKYKKATDEEKEVKEDTKILLYNNYRSRESVLKLTNQIFESIMSKEVGEMDYTKEEYLNFSKKFEEPIIDCTPELYIIETKEKIEEENNELSIEISEKNSRQIEEEELEKPVLQARFAAKKIKELVDKGFKYKDIVILLRSPKNDAPLYEKELLEQGIPVFSDTATDYLGSIEINTILSLLKIIDNPLQDIPLVTVLRSPIGGFTENELVDIRFHEQKVPFYKALLKTDTEKVKRFLALLEELKKAERELPLDELIWKIYSKTGYYHFVRLMPNGKLRQANLKKLFEKAKDYEKISFKGLFNFILFIEKVANSSKLQEAKIIGENDDVVRIMSIHKSKGLQFPIVFLCGLDKQINLEDLKQKIVLNQELGIGVDFIGEGMRYPTINKQYVNSKLKNEALSEEMRMLYVALTRAEEKLILVAADRKVRGEIEGKRKQLKNYSSDSKKGINPNLVKKCLSFLDWIEYVYIYNPELELRFEIIDRREFSQAKKYEKLEPEYEIKDKKINKEKYEVVDKLLNWEYGYKEAVEVPSKTSVSQLKREYNEEKEGNARKQIDSDKFNIEKLNKPVFDKESSEEIKGAKLGTLVHLALQNIDSSFTNLEDLLLKIKVTQEEKDALIENKYIIENFVKSELFESLKTAKEVYKETPFYMNIPYKDTKEQVLVQGVIDLFFIDKDDNIILVDYKTDRNVTEEDLINRYGYQLVLYKQAIEKSLKRKVSKVCIYSTYLNKTIEL